MKKSLAMILIIVLTLSCFGCNKLKEPKTNLEFWIAENVSDVDFSNFQIKHGTFGGERYYGTGYVPNVDENGQQIDPQYCVIYTVTSYPDYINKAQHVTRIEITDPKIEFYGLNLNSSIEDIMSVMSEQGFNVIESEYGITAKKGKFTFDFNKRSSCISIKVKVSNVFGIVF